MYLWGSSTEVAFLIIYVILIFLASGGSALVSLLVGLSMCKKFPGWAAKYVIMFVETLLELAGLMLSSLKLRLLKGGLKGCFLLLNSGASKSEIVMEAMAALFYKLEESFDKEDGFAFVSMEGSWVVSRPDYVDVSFKSSHIHYCVLKGSEECFFMIPGSMVSLQFSSSKSGAFSFFHKDFSIAIAVSSLNTIHTYTSEKSIWYYMESGLKPYLFVVRKPWLD